MELTDKCKKEFQGWYLNQNFYIECVVDVDGNTDRWNLNLNDEWFSMPDSMKYGVYQDYFDSVGITIRILTTRENFFYAIRHHEGDISTRPEARTASILKANEIRNKQLNS